MIDQIHGQGGSQKREPWPQGAIRSQQTRLQRIEKGTTQLLNDISDGIKMGNKAGARSGVLGHVITSNLQGKHK